MYVKELIQTSNNEIPKLFTMGLFEWNLIPLKKGNRMKMTKYKNENLVVWLCFDFVHFHHSYCTTCTREIISNNLSQNYYIQRDDLQN